MIEAGLTTKTNVGFLWKAYFAEHIQKVLNEEKWLCLTQ